ncbi:MAG: hypothetical protein LBU65_09840 [Planctomycetaceae bacterium]|jgi:hypothetical protein|nr:hypothetical protein [Planctomycetaceae bacterium]
MRYGFCLLAICMLALGCQGPAFTGGYSQGLPYRGVGVDGPGPGVIQEPYQQMSYSEPFAQQTQPNVLGQSPVGMPNVPPMGVGFGAPPQSPMVQPVMVAPTSQIHFVGPEGMVICWDETVRGRFDSEPLVCPARYDFPQGRIYRLKLTGIQGYAGVELYPTLEVAPTMARTQAYLAHNVVPVEFTTNDFEQAISGNFVTKVVYLPNPEYQGLAMAGVGTIVNTQLEPGADPVVEAGNRGAILAVIRLGNKDLQASVRADGQQGQTMSGQQINQPVYPAFNGSTIPQNAISGVTIPQYGIPITKTTTGVPGPPQLPQGMHATDRYPVRRAEPIVAPPQPGAAIVQPQPYVGVPVSPVQLDPRTIPQPRLSPR